MIKINNNKYQMNKLIKINLNKRIQLLNLINLNKKIQLLNYKDKH